MNAEPSTAVHKPENWLPILEISVQEVFEIMLGCAAIPAPKGLKTSSQFTAMVGLAGSLCGILTVSCSANGAVRLAARMLGPGVASSENQVCDALGEICNMIGGNFKNKLTGLDGRCMLSVPTVVTGEEYNFHSLADGETISVVLICDEHPITVSLELHS